jgi:hypothetical protein
VNVSFASTSGVKSTYSLGHANTGILDCEGLVLLVGDDVDPEILAGLELTRVGEGLISDLVEGIGTVGNQFSQEDLLVGVHCVDDQGEKLRDLSLELEGFARHGCGCLVSGAKRCQQMISEDIEEIAMCCDGVGVN